MVEMGQCVKSEGNRLLTELSAESHARISRHLESVFLEKGAVLYEPQSRPDYIYFPVTCVASVLPLAGCKEAGGEIAIVGHEGLVGTALFRGCDSAHHRIVIKQAGLCYRILSGFVTEEFIRCGDLMRMIFRYLGMQSLRSPVDLIYVSGA
jgi:hypothetical protein